MDYQANANRFTNSWQNFPAKFNTIKGQNVFFVLHADETRPQSGTASVKIAVYIQQE